MPKTKRPKGAFRRSFAAAAVALGTVATTATVAQNMNTSPDTGARSDTEAGWAGFRNGGASTVLAVDRATGVELLHAARGEP